jgi:hemerythrin-like domain-containing protein
MQSSLTQLLITEHDVILEAGNLVYVNGSLWESSPIEYEQKVKQLLNFFSVYADEYHHLKEEEILFPAIGKKNEMLSGGIIQELIEHHENFRLLIKQIQTALDTKEFAAAQELLETYISILKDHIAVENDELFPMADDIFNVDELDKLYYRCIDKDREMGKVRKEELGTCIKKFNNK